MYIYVYTQRNIAQPWKEWNFTICRDANGSRDCHTEWNLAISLKVLSPNRDILGIRALTYGF